MFLTRFYLPLLIALCFGVSWRLLGGGSDFWAHAAIGRWIVQNASIPHHTLYLWSAHDDWIAHSWLSQLSFYALMHVGGETWGPVLALLLTGALTALTVVVLWRAWALRARITLLTPLFFALAIWAGSIRARPRPELWSGLFFALLLAFLLHFQNAKKITPRALCGLVVMFILWANFHGGVASGLLLLGITAFADMLQERKESGQWKHSPLLVLLLCSLLVVCVNPYGPCYFSALSPVGGQMFSYIDEWKPVWEAPVMPWTFTGSGAMLAFFALLSWLGTEKRRWSHGAWLLVWSLLFLTARRHLWLWSLISLAVLAANAAAVDSRVFWATLRGMILKDDNNQRSLPLPASQLVFALRLTMLIFLGVATCQKTPASVLHQWPPRAVSRFLPAKAAQRLTQVAKNRRVFNDYEFSSYLQWRCAGQPPLFIDLLNAYPDQLLMDYFDILKATPRGTQLLREKKISAVFLRRHDKKAGMAKLATYLNRNSQWTHVYKAPDATIWLKKTDK